MTSPCWMSKAEYCEGIFGWRSREYQEALDAPGTCMLEAGHGGAHEWTPDGEIVITMAREEDSE